ncbi:MAG TPA: DUF1064 domain-containing protein [Dehalococcoidia bacterium]|nr:DUF1064 domain-containing protein [Dehalococcoidia bacterium]
MSLRFKDVSELPAHLRGQVEPAASDGHGARRSKYGNERIEYKGQIFDSKLERDRYRQLEMLWEAGQVCWFHRQVRFDLEGGVIYRADFQVIWPEGLFQRVGYEDAKGYLLPEAKNKLKQVRERYKIVIDLIMRRNGQLVSLPWPEL